MTKDASGYVNFWFTDNLNRLSEKCKKVFLSESRSGCSLEFVYWPGGNEQICICAGEDIVFPLKMPFTLTVECL